MCGIVGYLGRQEAMHPLLDCLGRLEYRGYDSAGIGTVADGKLGMLRSVGRNEALQARLADSPLPGKLGIAHTRWATHGRPSDANAHPHTDCHESLAIVHNGIIENHDALKKQLEKCGHRFASETDSEVIAHLLENAMAGGCDLETAARKSIPALEGAYALAVISREDPDKIIAARNGGPPLVIGHHEEGYYLASDITAILHHTRDIQVLEDGEIAVITPDGARIIDFDGRELRREMTRVSWQADAAQKGGYPHFMLKEIHEQPEAVRNTIQGQEILEDGTVSFPEGRLCSSGEMAEVKRLAIVACGTSWHAGLVGRYLIEAIAGLPVEVDIASEYRYRPRIHEAGTLVLGISQSGETADTLGALNEARARGATILSICNVVGSSMSRESDGVIYNHAGPEIGVASTKSFTCQLTALYLLAVTLGRARGSLSPERARALLDDLSQVPGLIESVLKQEEMIATLAEHFRGRNNALYLGRDIEYPLAIEGALKLKEISYIHAEGYPAGELKHGPIALIEKGLPVVVIATPGRLYGKVLAAVEEVKARDGMVIALAGENDREIAARADQVFHLPAASELLMPILAAVPLQLLAYHIAVQRGCDVDKPRNLAKSVTVE